MWRLACCCFLTWHASESRLCSYVPTLQVLTGKGGQGSELEEHVYPLIYELHKASGGIGVQPTGHLLRESAATLASGLTALARVCLAGRPAQPPQINPTVMLYIFPNVATQLGSEDSEVRTRAVGT